jgi:dienelactone hydrolase
MSALSRSDTDLSSVAVGPRRRVSRWHPRLRPALLLMLLAVAGTCGAQSLRVEPGPEVLEGQPLAIVADGLDAGETVRLQAERWHLAGGALRLWRSEAQLTADACGRMDLRSSAALSGSWTGVDPRGPFWSMARTSETPGAGVAADPTQVRLSLVRERGAPLSTRVKLLPALPDVIVSPVPELPGAVFARRAGGGRRPALILLGGSEGGASIGEAAAPLASHGFAVLTLPYYSPADDEGRREVPALPEAMVEIPVETLDRARDWLAARDDVDADRIGVHGTSVGATLALLGAVHLDWVDAVVASVPSDVVVDGWGPGIAEGERSAFSLRGEPLPFVPVLGYEEELARAQAGLDVRVRRAYERGRAAFPERAARARIPVEKIRGNVMLIGSYDDQMWASGQMASQMAERRLEAGLPVTALLFTEAGHALYQTGYAPTTRAPGRRREQGGSPQGDAQAQARAWPETLAFLRNALRFEDGASALRDALPEPVATCGAPVRTPGRLP